MADDPPVRCGAVRASMQRNPLLAKSELGKVRPSMFNNPPPDHVFGYTLPGDAEHAREVTMMWKEHTQSPGKDTRPDGRPMLDFKTMNIGAAKSGLTTAKEQPLFRTTHPATVKKFDHTHKAPRPLPSDKSAKHAYGMPSSHRTSDIVRNCGPQEPVMKHLVQGAYQEDWVKTNMHKESTATTAGLGNYIPPVPTRAVIGHTIGAQRHLRPASTEPEWKMRKFLRVGAKLPEWMGRGEAGAQFMQRPYQPEQAPEQAEQQIEQQGSPPVEAH